MYSELGVMVPVVLIVLIVFLAGVGVGRQLCPIVERVERVERVVYGIRALKRVGGKFKVVRIRTAGRWHVQMWVKPEFVGGDDSLTSEVYDLLVTSLGGGVGEAGRGGGITGTGGNIAERGDDYETV
jgi:hypothetical protein